MDKNEKPLFTLENVLNIKLPLSESQKKYIYELNSCSMIQYSNLYGIMVFPLENNLFFFPHDAFANMIDHRNLSQLEIDKKKKKLNPNLLSQYEIQFETNENIKVLAFSHDELSLAIGFNTKLQIFKVNALNEYIQKKDFQPEPDSKKDFEKEIEFISWEKSGAKIIIEFTDSSIIEFTLAESQCKTIKEADKAFFSSIKENHLIKINRSSIISEKEYKLNEDAKEFKIINPFELERERFLLLGMMTSEDDEQVDFFQWKGVNCNDFQSEKFNVGDFEENEYIEPTFNVINVLNSTLLIMAHSQTDSVRCFTTNNDKLISINSTKSVRLKPKGGMYDSKFRSLTLMRNPLQQDQEKYKINYYDEAILINFPPSLLVLSSSGILTRYLLIYFKNNQDVHLSMKIKSLPSFESKKPKKINPVSQDQEAKQNENSSCFMQPSIFKSTLPAEVQPIFQKKEDQNPKAQENNLFKTSGGEGIFSLNSPDINKKELFGGGLFLMSNADKAKNDNVSKGLFSFSNDQTNSNSCLFGSLNDQSKKFDLSTLTGQKPELINQKMPNTKTEQSQMVGLFGAFNLEKDQPSKISEKKAESEKVKEASLFSANLSNNQDSLNANAIGIFKTDQQPLKIFEKKAEPVISGLFSNSQANLNANAFGNVKADQSSKVLEKKVEPEKLKEPSIISGLFSNNQASLNTNPFQPGSLLVKVSGMSNQIQSPEIKKGEKKTELEKREEGLETGGFSNKTSPLFSPPVNDQKDLNINNNLSMFSNKKEQKEKEFSGGISKDQPNQTKANPFERKLDYLPEGPAFNKNNSFQNKNENNLITMQDTKPKKMQLDAPLITHLEPKPKKEDDQNKLLDRFPSLKVFFKLYEKIQEQIENTDVLSDIDFSSVGREEIIDKNEFIKKKAAEFKQIHDSINKMNNQEKDWRSTIEKITIILQKKNEICQNASSVDNVFDSYFKEFEVFFKKTKEKINKNQNNLNQLNKLFKNPRRLNTQKRLEFHSSIKPDDFLKQKTEFVNEFLPSKLDEITEKISKINLHSNKIRKEGKIAYSDNDEDFLDSERTDSDIPNTNDKDNIFILFSFDRQKDYMDRVKRLQGKVMTKSLSNKIDERLKKHAGKYYFSDSESEEEEKLVREEEEDQKKELIAGQNKIIKQVKMDKELPLIGFPPSTRIPEQDKNKSGGIFSIRSNNNDLFKDKDKLGACINMPENDKSKFPSEQLLKDPIEPKIKKTENFNFNFPLGSVSNQVNQPNIASKVKPIHEESSIEKNPKGEEKKIKTEFNSSNTKQGGEFGLAMFPKNDLPIEPKKEIAFKIFQSPEKKPSDAEGLRPFQKKEEIKSKDEINVVKSQGGLFGTNMSDLSLKNPNDAASQGLFGRPIQTGGLFTNLNEKKEEKKASISENVGNQNNKPDASKTGIFANVAPNFQEIKLQETSNESQKQHFEVKGNGKKDEINALQSSAPFFNTANSQSIIFNASSFQKPSQPQSQPQTQPQPQPQTQPQPQPQPQTQPQTQPQPQPQPQPQSQPQLQPQPQPQPQPQSQPQPQPQPQPQLQTQFKLPVQPTIPNQPPVSLFSQQKTDNKTNALFGNNSIQNNNNKNPSNSANTSFPAFAQPQPGNQPQNLSFGMMQGGVSQPNFNQMGFGGMNFSGSMPAYQFGATNLNLTNFNNPPEMQKLKQPDHLFGSGAATGASFASLGGAGFLGAATTGQNNLNMQGFSSSFMAPRK